MQESKQHLEPAVNRNIVVAVDTSAKSEKMVDWTIRNIARPGDHVHALHVIPAIPTTPVYQMYAEGIVSILPGPTAEDVEERRKQLHTDLGNRLTALLPADGVQTPARLGFQGCLHCSTFVHALRRVYNALFLPTRSPHV